MSQQTHHTQSIAPISLGALQNLPHDRLTHTSLLRCSAPMNGWWLCQAMEADPVWGAQASNKLIQEALAILLLEYGRVLEATFP